ncbi:uncharacterized protein LOC122500751 [Leptopilina heterotoma]|uniref:uncharacterized protein LOC122500751 n=1 Tax=Leptopilina heterotoma TaxID=63436 RepID=UPI001CAA1A11|nr:uncharacterized protein LOC122500751 [Leptopilina heterotoma]
MSATLAEFVSPEIVVLMSKSKPIQCQSSNIFIDYSPKIVNSPLQVPPLTNSLIMFILLSLFFITALVAVFSPLLKKKNVTLPFSGWYPYSLESEGFFVSTYLFQSVCIIMAACTTASVEGLALAIIPQICTQLEIIFYRLHYLPNLLMKHRFNDEDCLKETMFVKDCVKHHMHIYANLPQYSPKSNGIKGATLAEFISLEIVVLMSKSKPELCQLSSTFIYYSPEIVQVSMAIADAVEQMNWITLSQQSKRVLLILMIRSSLPIKLTGSSIVVMSIKTFVKV